MGRGRGAGGRAKSSTSNARGGVGATATVVEQVIVPEAPADAVNTAAAAAAYDEYQADAARDEAVRAITEALADESLSHAQLLARVEQVLPDASPEERQRMLDEIAFAAEDTVAAGFDEPDGTNPFDADDEAAAEAFARAAEEEAGFDLTPEPEIADEAFEPLVVQAPQRNHGVAAVAENRRRPTPKQVSAVGGVFADSAELDDPDTAAIVWHEMQQVNAVTRAKLGKEVLPSRGDEASEFILDAVSYVHNERDRDPDFDVPTEFPEVFKMFTDVQRRRKQLAAHGAVTREAVTRRERDADRRAGTEHHVAADLPEHE